MFLHLHKCGKPFYLDGAELEDLRTYTRHLMGRMEADLGTSLDWVAVNHWNTDNPHTHIVVRG